MSEDIKEIKEKLDYLVEQSKDTKEIKRDLNSLVTQQRLLHFVQQSSSSSIGRPENPDITSDAASTASTGSDGTYDYSFKTKCLSDALQSHFLEIIRNVPYEIIADKVVEQQVVTVEENERIQGLASEHDKRRSLALLSMKKSHDTMQKYLEIIGECKKSLKESILNIFNDRYIGHPPNKFLRCVVCQIKNRTNINNICDHLLTRHLISRDLYDDVTKSRARKGSEALWQRVFDQLANERSEYILNVFKGILSDGEDEDTSHYDDIVKVIDRDIQKCRRFQCRCQKDRKIYRSPLPPSTRPSEFKSPKSNPELQDSIEELMEGVNESSNRLKEILFRPNPLSMHIELMIEAETMEKKEGFQNRITALMEYKKKAEITRVNVERLNQALSSPGYSKRASKQI